MSELEISNLQEVGLEIMDSLHSKSINKHPYLSVVYSREFYLRNFMAVRMSSLAV